MFKALFQIDLFGKPVSFNYKGYSKSRSKAGTIFTIILFAFIIWVTVYFGQQLLDTTNPKAASFDSFNDNPAATPMSIDNFAFALGMAHPVTYANYINESIYTISASTYKTTRVPQSDGTVEIIYEMVPLEMESCRPDHFGELSESFSYLALDGLYCLKKEQPGLNNGQPILEGNWESPVFQGIFIDFLECDRNVSTNCGTQEEIDYLLKAGLLTLVFSNMAVDLTDSQKPLKKFRDGWYTSTGSDYNKEINLYLQQLEINTDNGWLTSEFQTENYIKFGEIREMFTLAKKSNYVHFVIRLSNVMKHFNRSYTKIQDIIAQINGTILVTFTILVILLAPYVRLKFYETLINDIFDVKMSKRNKKSSHIARKATKIKSEDQKIQQKLSINKGTIRSNVDLEVQKIPSQLSNEPVLTNRIGLIEGKDTDDFNLLRAGVTLEESCPTKHNFIDVMLRPSRQISQQNKYLQDDRDNESKRRINFSQSRGQSAMPLNLSEFQSEKRRRDNCDLTIPALSSRDSKQERLLTPRKPSFLKPHFKILDYEEHGQDLFEDILKNIEPPRGKDDKDQAEDEVISAIRSEEKEKEDLDPPGGKTTREQKEDLSQMLRSNEDDEKENQLEYDKAINRNKPTSTISMQKLDLITTKKSDQINLSFWEYIRSFFSKSEDIKTKMNILNEGINRINERLDIFNVFKKLREFDKLKVLLLENEQFVLFHSLPRPELTLKDNVSTDVNAPTNIKDPQFIQQKLKKDLILLSYQYLKGKKTSTMLDKKLLEIYDDILCVKS